MNLYGFIEEPFALSLLLKLFDSVFSIDTDIGVIVDALQSGAFSPFPAMANVQTLLKRSAV